MPPASPDADDARASRLFRASALSLALTLAGCAGLDHAPSKSAPAYVPSASTLERPVEWFGQNNPSPLAAQDVWERMREGFALQDALEDNPRIRQQRLWFAGNPDFLQSAAVRGTPYIHYIVECLEERGMPLELALLPMIESAYNPLAYSPAQAVGLWQFIPSTGRHFNLAQNSWYDGRSDVAASTNAALNYLTRLHDMFNGDWLLALAAYNAGEGTVSRAIERNEKLGLPTDYWNLGLPQETQDYVPKLLALSEVVMSPDAYGVSLAPIANEPYFQTVEVDRRMRLSRLAKLADLDENELLQLNPAFKRGITLDGPQQLLVPADKAEQLAQSLAALSPDDFLKWQEYQVRSGDSLYTIARRYRLTVDEIKSSNKLRSNRLAVGQLLTLPLPGELAVSSDEKSQLNKLASSSQRYRVRNGDNLWDIARRYRVSVKDLKRWNGLAGNALKVGQNLTLYVER